MREITADRLKAAVQRRRPGAAAVRRRWVVPLLVRRRRSRWPRRSHPEVRCRRALTLAPTAGWPSRATRTVLSGVGRCLSATPWRPHPAGAGVVGVAFSPDGRSLITVASKGWSAFRNLNKLPVRHPLITVAFEGMVRRWPVPQPVEGNAARLARARGWRPACMDASQASRRCRAREWEQERRCGRETEGDADWAVGASVSDAEWHDARAPRRRATRRDLHGAHLEVGGGAWATG
jgi:hypothetical protein